MLGQRIVIEGIEGIDVIEGIDGIDVIEGM
jgi:hypothetical protein